MATYGFSSLNKSLNSNDKGQLSTPKPDQITVGRVTKVYIDPNNPSQIGWVEYVNVNTISKI